jgi:RNA polymerase sigma factor (sigma-70 family)
MSGSDLELLAQYTRQQAEDAFAEIVRRHLDLVFSAALRQVRSPQLAEEVAQSAFTDLARQAHRLAPDTVVTAWLYQVTRRTAIDVVRREGRRQLREQVACELNAMNTTAADWTHIEPLLDEAMQALEETDRTAVLLRYFENKSLREVGQTLGTNEDAARKRVSRAVERLREFFAQRGVTVGASGLIVALSANAVQAAPVGLAVTISTAAAILAGTTLATTATTTATKVIAMTTLQKTLFGVTLAAAVGTGIYQARQNSRLGEEVQSLHQTLTPLREEVAQLQTENERLSNLVAQARQPARLPVNQFNELLKLRGKAQLSSREIAELKAALAQGTRIPDFVTKSVNEFLDSAADQERRAQTNGALGRINRMSAKLGLGPEQQQPVHDIILANADPRADLAMARVTGSMSSLEEIKTRLAKILADEDGALAGVLTPEQMTAYQQMMRADEENAGAQAWVAYEKSIMQRELKLSDEQAEQMSSIFANLKPGSGGPGITEYSNAREQLEIRLRAFASALTPEQLQNYRRLKMEDIEQHEQIPRIIKALKQ